MNKQSFRNYRWFRDQYGWICETRVHALKKDGSDGEKWVRTYYSTLTHLLQRIIDWERGDVGELQAIIDHDNAVLDELKQIAGVLTANTAL